MLGRVIQGFFIGGAMPPRTAPRMATSPQKSAGAIGAPALAFSGRSGGVQARMALGRPPLAHHGLGQAAQAHGANGNFEIDPAQVGLNRGGGNPLPQSVLAKMEAAFGADFSRVRVHVGPQASRIGALAFTMGDDLYFAPGQFQPESVKGQQLIGHELAHVIQQRQGRVRAPGNGVAVVQDHALEAEADRLGMRAAAHRVAAGFPIQRKFAGHRIMVGPPMAMGSRASARAIQTFTRPSGETLQPMSWGMIGTLGILGGAFAGGAAVAVGAVAMAGASAVAVGGLLGLGATELAGRYMGGGNPNDGDGSGHASIYDPSQSYGEKTMAISRAVYNKSKGHTLVAFEWLEKGEKVHQIYHFAGDEAPFWKQATLGGQGSVKFVSNNGGKPKGVEAWNEDYAGQSTPDTFFDRSSRISWDSYAQTWVVKLEKGKKALLAARARLGVKHSFRVTPWLPTAYNCVQMANEILAEAGIYASSPIDEALSIFAPRINSQLKLIKQRGKVQ